MSDRFSPYFLDFTLMDIPERHSWDPSSINDKKCIVLVDDTIITPEQSDLLNKILSSIGLNAETEVCIEQFSSKKVFPLSQIDKEFKVICFGLNPSHLGLQIEATANKLVTLDNKEILFTASLPDLENTKEEKMKLWGALKNWK